MGELVVDFRWDIVRVICSLSVCFFFNVGVIFGEVYEVVFFDVVYIESNDGDL